MRSRQQTKTDKHNFKAGVPITLASLFPDVYAKTVQDAKTDDDKHINNKNDEGSLLDLIQSKQATTPDVIKEHIEVIENRMPTSKFLIETTSSSESTYDQALNFAKRIFHHQRQQEKAEEKKEKRKDRKLLEEEEAANQKGSYLANSAADDKKWFIDFKHLVDFFHEHGHTNVSIIQRHTNDAQLVKFVKSQRNLYRKKELSKEKIRLLEKIGFYWDPPRNCLAINDEDDGGKSINSLVLLSSVAAISMDENYGDKNGYLTASSSNDENDGYKSEDRDSSDDGYLIF